MRNGLRASGAIRPLEVVIVPVVYILKWNKIEEMWRRQAPTLLKILT